MIRHLHEPGMSLDRVLATIQRLYLENPTAMKEFMEWVEESRHTKTVSLVFHGGQLKCARAELTSRKAEGET